MNLSVIIPVYNAERFLKKAVESALRQPEVSEVILIEDNSPDDALSICKDLVQEHEKVSLYRHPNGENKGAGASRNLGIQKAKGKYIAFLDADDYYLEGRFARDLEILEKDANIDGVYNVLGTVFYDKEEESRWQGSSDIHKVNQLTGISGTIPPELLFENMGPIGKSGHFHIDTLTVRKSLFEKSGYFNTALELSQDTHLFIKMSLVGRLVPGDRTSPVAIRGLHNSNRVKNSKKMMTYRPLLFESLYFWAGYKSIKTDRKFKLWQNYYDFSFIYSVQNVTLRKRIQFLLKSFIGYPGIIFYKPFWRRFPIIGRLLFN